MKQTHYLTTKVQKGHRVELTLPDLIEGEIVEVILIVPEQKTSLNNRYSDSLTRKQNIMKKTIQERRNLLEEQA